MQPARLPGGSVPGTGPDRVRHVALVVGESQAPAPNTREAEVTPDESGRQPMKSLEGLEMELGMWNGPGNGREGREWNGGVGSSDIRQVGGRLHLVPPFRFRAARLVRWSSRYQRSCAYNAPEPQIGQSAAAMGWNGHRRRTCTRTGGVEFRGLDDLSVARDRPAPLSGDSMARTRPTAARGHLDLRHRLRIMRRNRRGAGRRYDFPAHGKIAGRSGAKPGGHTVGLLRERLHRKRCCDGVT